MAQVYGSPQGAAFCWGKEPREVPRWTGTSHRLDIDGSPPCAIRRLAVIDHRPIVDDATTSGVGRESNREATDSGATRSHSQRRRLEHSTPTPTCAAPTQRPGLAVVHAFGGRGPQQCARALCRSGTWRPLPGLAVSGSPHGAPSRQSPPRRGAGLSRKVERGPTRPAHICYCWATGCPSPPRPGFEVTDLTVGRPAQRDRRSDHAGPPATVLPPGAPSAEET